MFTDEIRSNFATLRFFSNFRHFFDFVSISSDGFLEQFGAFYLIRWRFSKNQFFDLEFTCNIRFCNVVFFLEFFLSVLVLSMIQPWNCENFFLDRLFNFNRNYLHKYRPFWVSFHGNWFRHLLFFLNIVRKSYFFTITLELSYFFTPFYRKVDSFVFQKVSLKCYIDF